MHKDTISYIVNTTIRDMQIKNPAAFKMLIKMTFLMETNLQTTVNDAHTRFGFMAIERDELENLIDNYILPRPSVSKPIENVSLIDLRNDSREDIIEATIYNIAFQVAITWAAYIARFDEAPDIDPTSVAEKYLNFWKGEYSSDEMLMHCANKYQNVFAKR